MKPALLALAAAALVAAPAAPAGQPAAPADLIVHNAKVVTLDGKSTVARAVAVRGGKVVAVGSDDVLKQWTGTGTKLIDAGGKTVLPGLYDSHVHPVGAATSEAGEPLPVLGSIPAVLDYIKAK